MKIALTIAGSDSGGGAGVQADLQTFHQFGVFGTTVITAVTAQNTLGVGAVHPVPPALISAQVEAVVKDLRPAAIKTGMLGTAAAVDVVARAVRQHDLPNYVLDPIVLASSGDRLLEAEAERAMATELMPLATLVTPNLDEAARFTGDAVATPKDMERAGRGLLERGAAAALVTGGHLAGDEIVDVLVTTEAVRRYQHTRRPNPASHGTGCTLSAAVTAGLARGRPLERAIEDAIEFVGRAIAAATPLGSGRGPLNRHVPGPIDD